MHKYDYVVLIGRMQPFHLAHLDLLNEAISLAQKKVIIVLGSSFAARNIRNPFTASEREEMVMRSIAPSDFHKVAFVHQRDYFYNHNRWLSEVQSSVDVLTHESTSVALIGHQHDHTSHYLKDFPQWELALKPESNASPHATEIREALFNGSDYASNLEFNKFLPQGTQGFLTEWAKSNSPTFKTLQDEFSFIKAYKAIWSVAPYPVQFNTLDAVTVKSGHVLVIKRKGNPGKGLWALPGGFLNENESIQVGAIRELKEETRIKVSKFNLNAAIVYNRVFDHPNRSTRGRTITHVFLINLGNGPLPYVKGSDDAEQAKWLSFTEIDKNESEFFEDHWHIITHCLDQI